MPILNYTTNIPVERTLGEIQGILARSGARSVMVQYDNQGAPVALIFSIMVHGTRIDFRLPSRHTGIYKKLHDNTKIEIRLRTEDQARRVAWRIIKDWVEAQIAIIEAGQAELVEVFLPYAVSNSGKTVYEEFQNNLLLGSGQQESES
jgi:hypothetical protein